MIAEAPLDWARLYRGRPRALRRDIRWARFGVSEARLKLSWELESGDHVEVANRRRCLSEATAQLDRLLRARGAAALR